MDMDMDTAHVLCYDELLTISLINEVIKYI